MSVSDIECDAFAESLRGKTEVCCKWVEVVAKRQ